MIIFHIIFTLNIGGAETLLVDIINEQCKTDNVSICIIDDSFHPGLLMNIDRRVRVIKLGRKSGSRSLLPFIKLNYLIIAHKPDIIHIHNWQTPLILLPWIRPFFTVHGLDRPDTYFKRIKGFIAISEAVKADILNKGSYPVAVIPNGIVVDKIHQKRSLIIEKEFKIVQVGRLKSELKGQDILIEAIAVLRDLGMDNIYVDFIGDGESKDALTTLIEKFGLSDRIHFLGEMGRDQIYDSLCQYNLLCQPSRKEGFGLTVAESMIAKVPVLVSNTGGPYEIIEKGRLGYCFVSGDSMSCAKAIQKIINEYGCQEMTHIIECAFNKAYQEYSIENTVQLYKEYYLKNN